ncbi:hypothetical protein P9112_008707 [Eukaryota sp. TZLM1-RC]
MLSLLILFILLISSNAHLFYALENGDYLSHYSFEVQHGISLPPHSNVNFTLTFNPLPPTLLSSLSLSPPPDGLEFSSSQNLSSFFLIPEIAKYFYIPHLHQFHIFYQNPRQAVSHAFSPIRALPSSFLFHLTEILGEFPVVDLHFACKSSLYKISTWPYVSNIDLLFQCNSNVDLPFFNISPNSSSIVEEPAVSYLGHAKGFNLYGIGYLDGSNISVVHNLNSELVFICSSFRCSNCFGFNCTEKQLVVLTDESSINFSIKVDYDCPPFSQLPPTYFQGVVIPPGFIYSENTLIQRTNSILFKVPVPDEAMIINVPVITCLVIVAIVVKLLFKGG